LRSPTTQTGAVAAYTRDLATSPALVGAARRELAGADLARTTDLQRGRTAAAGQVAAGAVLGCLALAVCQ
jgi:hypothetical protein